MPDTYDGTLSMMLHILHNPDGWNDVETVHKVCNDAADMIEAFVLLLRDEDARHN